MTQYTPRKSTQRWLAGAPAHILACYDSGPNTCDRYTVLYGAPVWTPDMGRNVPYLAASAHPFHPQGFGQHGDMPASNRSALGRKIAWHDLPADVQRAAIQDGLPDIPADFPVRPLRDITAAVEPVTCGTCGHSWDDAIATSYTPSPSARCPFEAFHF